MEDLLVPGIIVRRLHFDVKLSLKGALKSPLTGNTVSMHGVSELRQSDLNSLSQRLFIFKHLLTSQTWGAELQATGSGDTNQRCLTELANAVTYALFNSAKNSREGVLPIEHHNSAPSL